MMEIDKAESSNVGKLFKRSIIAQIIIYTSPILIVLFLESGNYLSSSELQNLTNYVFIICCLTFLTNLVYCIIKIIKMKSDHWFTNLWLIFCLGLFVPTILISIIFFAGCISLINMSFSFSPFLLRLKLP